MISRKGQATKKRQLKPPKDSSRQLQSPFATKKLEDRITQSHINEEETNSRRKEFGELLKERVGRATERRSRTYKRKSWTSNWRRNSDELSTKETEEQLEHQMEWGNFDRLVTKTKKLSIANLLKVH